MREAARRSTSRTWSSCTTPNAERDVRPIGVLGGTFDPVHVGHLAAARQVRAKADLSRVWLMPNAQPPHRPDPPSASAEDRLAMVALAVRGDPMLEACDLEVRRGGRSYTVDSIEILEREYPGRSFALLLGADEGLAIRSWRDPDRLLRNRHVVIFTRAGSGTPDRGHLIGLGFDPERTRVVAIDSPDVSAHEIRRLLQHGESIDALVPPAVNAYIREHRLYLDAMG